jgi:serine/threonine protein kinase
MNEPHDPSVTSDLPAASAKSLRPADTPRTTEVEHAAASTDEPQPAADAPRGDLPAVPGYRVLHEIARGGMGRVLAAYDLGLDREVALKVLLPGANSDRFVRESKITARLPHPGIPPVHALGALADGSPFLAMKLIAGRTLTDEMKTADRPRLLQAFTQVCQAVGFAHSKGVVHRDLKPANVMVGAFGEVQVMDWGLAKDLAAGSVATKEEASRERQRPEDGTDPNQTSDDRATGESTDDRTHAGQVLGTPAYMAPEQARGEPTDARCDVFALGGILCAILTGEPPFGGKTNLEVIRRAAAADLAAAHARLDGCGADAELVAVCRRCLNPSLAERPADGQAVADGVTAYLNGVQERLHQAELAEAEAKAKAVEEAKRRRLTLALAGTVVLALTLGGGAWLYVKNERDAQHIALIRDVNDAMNAATTLRAQGQLERAREEAQRALARVESGPADAALKDQVTRLKADLDEEMNQLNNRQLVMDYIDRGLKMHNAHRPDEAIACYRKAIELEQKNAVAHSGLGTALYGKGQVDEAFASWRRAIALDPKNAEARFNLAVVPLVTDSRNSTNLVLFGSGSAFDHYNLGVWLARLGKLDEAMACFKKAVELDPEYAKARTELAKAKRLAVARDKLPAFQNGSYTPASSDERVDLVVCHTGNLG